MLRRYSFGDEPTPLLRIRRFLIPHLIHPIAPKVSEWLEEVADPFPVELIDSIQDNKDAGGLEERLKKPSKVRYDVLIDGGLLEDVPIVSTAPVSNISDALANEKEAFAHEHNIQTTNSSCLSATPNLPDIEKQLRQHKPTTSNTGYKAKVYKSVCTLKGHGRTLAIVGFLGVCTAVVYLLSYVKPRAMASRLRHGIMFVLGLTCGR
jgi:hypothetical protein